jgi:hypothetical protein
MSASYTLNPYRSAMRIPRSCVSLVNGSDGQINRII